MEYLKYGLAILLSVTGLSTSIADDTKAAQQSSDTQPISDQSTIQPSPEQIATWVANLGSDSFQLRRESFVRLWRAGKPGLQAIQAAMLSTDKQQAETANTLEILIRLNVTVDDPSEAADLLSELSHSPESALVKLCERGYWNVAVQLLDMNTELLGTLRLSEDAYSRMNLLVDVALEQGDVTLAWPTICKIIPYQQALWIAKKQGLEPPEIDLSDPVVQAWDHFMNGRHAEVQATTAPVALRADMAVRGFQWGAFSDSSLMLGLIGQRKSAGQDAARAVMLEFAGKLPESEAIWDVLIPKFDESVPKSSVPKETPRGENDADDSNSDRALTAKYIQTDPRILESIDKLQVDPGSLERVLTGMLLSGRAQIVQDYLLQNFPEAAWSFCLVRGEQEAALSSMGLSSDFSNFKEWLEKRRDELHAEAQKIPGLSSLSLFQTTILLASDMQTLGRFDEADETYKVLVNVCKVARQRNNEYWVVLAGGMTRAEARYRFLDILAANYSKMDESLHDQLLSILYPECESSALALFETAPELKHEGKTDSKWHAIEQLYAYNREYFGPQHGKILSAWLQRALSKLSQNPLRSRDHLAELAKLADGVGLSNLALEFASETTNGSIELWSYAGRALKERGSLKEAIKLFSDIRRADSSHQEAILDEASSLLMLGRVTEAQALQKSRWLRPLLIFGERSWFAVAQRLSTAGRFELAKEYMDPTFQLFGCVAPNGIALQHRDFVAVAQEYSQIADELKDVELAANLYRTMLVSWLSNMKPRSYPPATYASLGAKERTRRATLAALNNDMVAFERHARVAESLQPQGIDLVEDTFHELVASGNQQVADELFTRFEKRLLEHLKNWPKDATTHNNLAWMYARCNLKLEEALEHSQLAVELSPHSAVLLDTLAEVQFRLNQYSAAIDSMRRCIQLDPRDPHLRRQLTRFLKAQLESRR